MAPKTTSHLGALKPIPKEASEDPIGWAQRHLETLYPVAAKELEWQLSYGTASQRADAMKELLSAKNLVGRQANTSQGVVPPITLVVNTQIVEGNNAAPSWVRAIAEPPKQLESTNEEEPGRANQPGPSGEAPSSND